MPQQRLDEDDWAAELEWPPDAKAIGCGLHNLGNTCFVNSVLQCLTHTPPLALGCLQLREDVLRTLPGGMGSANVMRMLAEHIRDALTSDVRPFTPSLASQMHEVSTYLTPGQQEDSHEFVRLLIDAASRQTAAERKGANGSRPFIENLFLGQLQSTVRCAVCGGISRSAEDFLDLSLEIGADGDEADAEGLGRRRGSGCGDGSGSGGTGPGGGRDAQGGHNSLMDALRAFLGVEQLEDADQYYCERCKARVCAEKQLRLHRLPPILLLHLKRFRQLRWGRSKIAGHVSFPPILDLRGLREGEQAGSDDGSEGAPEADSGVCAPVRDGSGGLGSGGEVASRSGSPPHPQAGAEPPAPSFGLRNGGANAAEAPAAEGDDRSSGRRAGRAAEVAAKLSLAHAAGSSQSHTGSGESAAFPSQTPLRSGAPARASAGQHSAAGKRPRGRKAAGAAGAAAGGQAHDDGYNGRYDDRYVLYAVIVHRGRSVQSGHYLAYVHSLVKPTASGRAGDGSEGDGNPGGQGAGEAGGGDAGSGGSGWWCFDDSHVYAVDEECVLSQPAYMCFYVRESWWQFAPALVAPACLPHGSPGARGARDEAEAWPFGSALSGLAGCRLWLLANLALLACCVAVAHAQLELLTAETRWSADQLSALASGLGARLRSTLAATAEPQAQPHRGPANSGTPFEPTSSHYLSGALPQLEELSEGLAPVLFLVVLVNFSLKHVLGSLSYLSAGPSSSRAAASGSAS